MSSLLLPSRVRLNDIHSQLNACHPARLLRPETAADVQELLHEAAHGDVPVAFAGARHAMGGQQFVDDGWVLDMRGLDALVAFDAERGLIEVGAGADWTTVKRYLDRAQPDAPEPWTFAQKQTGADDLTLGGSLAANIHGRGLAMAPFVQDIEAFTLVDAGGRVLRASRAENARLFRLAVGGYGLFGAVTSVQLRLRPRALLRRDVTIIDIGSLPGAVLLRREAGYEYGDFQFDIDPASPGFLRRGVFSCYCPVAGPVAPAAMGGEALTPDRWRAFVMLAHTDKAEAYRRYTEMYLATDGRHYWSDAAQMNYYEPGYHARIDRTLGHAGSEMITELYMPPEHLESFMARAAADFRADGVEVIYGTVRFIRADLETFLPWARRDYACVVFNIHTAHDPAAIAALRRTTRRLIQHALALSGSYYLTYHRNATEDQVLAAYPRFPQFLAWKRYYDPAERFQSEWYRHYRAVAG